MLVVAVLCLIAMLSGALAGFYIGRVIKDANNTNIITFLDQKYDNLSFTRGANILIATIDEKDIVIDLNGNVIDENTENGKIQILHGDYYKIELEDNVILKRNNREIKRLSEINDHLDIFRYSEDSEAISFFFNTLKDNSFSEAKIATYNGTSFLYSTTSGDIYIKDVKNINPLYIGDEIKFFVVVKEDNSVVLLSIDDLHTEIPLNGSVVSDEIRIGDNAAYRSRNTNYIIIVDENGNHGLIDMNGNEIIAPKYDDLYFYDNSGLLVAKYNDKYGIINSQDEILLPFDYYGIVIKDNFIVVIYDEQIGVKNREFNYIIPLHMPYTGNFALRGFENNFIIITSDDYLIIQTEDNTSIFNAGGIVKSFEDITTHLLRDINNIINDFYIITEELNNNSVSLSIYNNKGDNLNSMDITVNTTISTIVYSFLNTDTIKLIIYDDMFNTIDSMIISVEEGKVITRNAENRFSGLIRLNDLVYIREDGNLRILENNIEIAEITGEALFYINDNTYALYLGDKWQLIKINP